MSRIYEHRCPRCDAHFDSEKMRDEVCPSCGTVAIRIFSARSLWHPSKPTRKEKKA